MVDPPEVPREEPDSFEDSDFFSELLSEYVRSRRESARLKQREEILEIILPRRMWQLLRKVNDWAKAHNIQVDEREGIPDEEFYFEAVDGDKSYTLVVKPQIYEMQVEKYLKDPTGANYLGTMGYYFNPAVVEASREENYSRDALIGFSPPAAKFHRTELAPNVFGWKVRPGDKEDIYRLDSVETPAVNPFAQANKILSLLSTSRRIVKLDPDIEEIIRSRPYLPEGLKPISKLSTE